MRVSSCLVPMLESIAGSHGLKMTAGKAWDPSSTACCRRGIGSGLPRTATRRGNPPVPCQKAEEGHRMERLPIGADL
jgi:hypothetical protein